MRKFYVAFTMLLIAAFGFQAHAQNARVQIIHNSGDPAARLVDVLVDGGVAVERLAYREATSYVDIPAGAREIGIAVYDSDEEETTVVGTFNLTLVDGETYVVMATGVASPDDFAANPDGISTAFDLAVFAGATESGTGTGSEVTALVYHGATDAPAVDVNAGGATVVGDIEYKEFVGLAQLPADDLFLDINVAGTATTAAIFNADISGLGGGAAVVFASGFLSPLDNQGGANFALLAALPNGTVVSFPEVRDEFIVTDNTGDGTTTWTNDNIYVLDGFVFVEEGDTLNIEPGTVIKGRTGQGAQASALIVARGGYINAQGTSTDPIIFTSLVDDTENLNDIPLGTKGLWGGVIILGKATLNSEPGETAIEGIPTTETRGLYGGDDDTDNSGIFRYVSIRHGSTNIGAGNEINGLTMGGVGSGTTIEFVEVFNGADDGFEWFGGTVNTKWLISAYNDDDAFDYDEGWRGQNQFWLAVQVNEGGIDSDRGGEHDGGTSPETGAPFATPVIYNATFIGGGDAAAKRTITFRDNAGGEYHNSIFTEYGRGIDVEKLASGEHSFSRLQNGDLKLENNIFWNVADNVAANILSVGVAGDAADETFIDTYFSDNGNMNVDPGLQGISRTRDGGLDPRPGNVAAYSGLGATPSGDFFSAVNFKGAFGSSTNLWAAGWSYLDELGFFPAAPAAITLPTAEVQIIHNSGDPDARLVQISVNGEVAVDQLAYREATPFVEVPAGTAVVTVGVFNGDEDEIVASVDFSLELTADEKYVVVATGVLSPDDFAANPDGTSTAFDLAVFTPGQDAGANGAGNVDALVYHGATDAPAVDVNAGGSTVIPNLAYKSFAGYAALPAAALQLDINVAGTETTAATFDVDLSGLGGGAAVVFASGFLSPLDNEGGANFALLAALPDGTVVSFPEVRDEVVVTDNTGDGTTTWTSDNIYVLDGFVFVEAGDTLIIEPGTVVKGRTGQGAQASALIVARDGHIIANGTSSDPIIFTTLVDDTNDPNDIPLGTKGLWGGVIILGNATLNSEPGETAIEGIPTTETRGLYGGDDDTDNSGIFRYVSIRHGSTNIGAGNEINGLTMGGVGSGTTIEFVEVFNSADDGFEWFGGTVGSKWLISAFNDDDAFDYDEGWRGANQFWFAIQTNEGGIDSDRGGEHDGGTSPETGTPFATPVVYNATFIGGGDAANKRTITFRDNAGGEYHNSIFTEYGRGIDVEKLSSGTHSFDRLQAGELKLENNIFWNVADNDAASVFTVAGSGAEEADQTFIQGYFGDNGNEVANPGIVSISRTNDGGLDPRPQAGAAIFNPTLTAVPAGDFFSEVTFKGAFGSNNWARNWTYLEERGFFGNTSVVSVEDDLSEAERNLSIFPNPATSVISISVADVLRSAEVEMFNINGQSVFARSANAVNSTVDMTVDVSTLPAGLYFVRVNTQEAVVTKTVIVE